MPKKYVLGLDIGTTSAKAVIFQMCGQVVSEQEVGYPLHHPQPGWAEQNADQIEKAALRAIQQALSQTNFPTQQIIAVGLSAAMHTLVCVDQNHTPLSPVITWADGRSRKQSEYLKAQHRDIYAVTGTPLHPMSPLSKLMWMQETEYKAYQQASHYISIKEYLLAKWFDHTDARYRKVDYAIASATGMFNIHTLQWEPQALQLAGIREEQLYEPAPPTHIFEGLKSTVADQMGLHHSIPFIIGASDGPLANLGVGAIKQGETAITIGTSGAVRQIVNTPKTDERQEVFCYAFTEDTWVVGGATNNGGTVLQWLKETLGPFGEDDLVHPHHYEYMLQLAAQVSPGADGLLFLPYLHGERAPYWQQHAQGTLFGLRKTHHQEHVIRAGLEGVIYIILHIAESMSRLGFTHQHILASGGFARSPLWLSILADAFGHNIHVPNSHHSSAWGAAWLALYALGEVPSLAAIKENIPMQQNVAFTEAHHEVYKQQFQQFKQLAHLLQPYFLGI